MELYTDPIYIHFFEAHFRKSYKNTITDELIYKYLSVASLLTNSFVYINNALILESSQDFPSASRLAIELEKEGIVKLVSNFANRNDFIVDRKKIYENQKQLFPVYFTDDFKLEQFAWPQNITLLNTYTTDVMINEFRHSILNSENKIAKDLNITGDINIILNLYNEKINNFEGFNSASFNKFLSYNNLKEPMKFDFNRIINYLYTKRYLELFSRSKVLCGIPGFTESFSEIEYNPFYDYRLYDLIFNFFGIFPKVAEDILRLKFDVLFQELLVEIRIILSGICNYEDVRKHKTDRATYSSIIFNKLKTVLENTVHIKHNKVHNGLVSLIKIRNRLEQDYQFMEGIGKMEVLKRKKVLIIVSTLLELKTLLKTLKKRKSDFTEIHLTDYVYYLSKDINKNYDIYIVKTQMGSVNYGGSIMSLIDVNNKINPDIFVMAGICFGLRQDKNKLGDIVVARQICSYESGKMTDKEFISRAPKLPTSLKLLNYSEASSINWTKCTVDFGLFISGEKLVNSTNFVRWMKTNVPEALAGDMEAAGLANVGYFVKKDWILLKSICDWGYSKSDDNQQLAANNVMEYLVYTLKNHFY